MNEEAIERVLRVLYVDLERATSYEKRNLLFADCAKRIAGMADDEVVSAAEAAEMLGVSRQRVQVLLQHGQLDGYKVGNAWSVYKASVQRRMAKR